MAVSKIDDRTPTLLSCMIDMTCEMAELIVFEMRGPHYCNGTILCPLSCHYVLLAHFSVQLADDDDDYIEEIVPTNP